MSTKLRTCAAALTAISIVALTPMAAGATFPGDNGRIIVNRGSFENPTFLISMEPDGSDVTRLTGGGRNSFGASWSPDGSRFIYSRFNLDGTVDLFLRDADGTNPTRVTDNNRDEFGVAFGPDGNQAVYGKCGFRCDLFIVDLTTLTETRLTDTPRADEFSPDWSVDNVIVFDRAPRRGDLEIFSIEPNGANLTQLTDNQGRQDVSGFLVAGRRRDRLQPLRRRVELRSLHDERQRIRQGPGHRHERDEFGAKFSPNGLSSW